MCVSNLRRARHRVWSRCAHPHPCAAEVLIFPFPGSTTTSSLSTSFYQGHCFPQAPESASIVAAISLPYTGPRSSTPSPSPHEHAFPSPRSLTVHIARCRGRKSILLHGSPRPLCLTTSRTASLDEQMGGMVSPSIVLNLFTEAPPVCPSPGEDILCTTIPYPPGWSLIRTYATSILRVV